MLLVAVVVIAVAGFAVYRLNGIFGSHDVTSTGSGNDTEIVPFNPKHVVLEVFGPPGTVATITYLDVNAQPQRVDDTTLPWSYDTTTTQPAVFVNVSAQGDSHSIGCRIKIDDVVKDERTVNTVERLHLLPGQVRMSTDQAERQSMTDRAAKRIRVLCVPIVMFWVAVAALTNVLVPQLEKVGEEHNVALSSPDSPSLQAFKRIGEKFQEFDSDSAAMVVLEGDQPLGADAHQLLRHSRQGVREGHQARPARAGLLGRPAHRGRLAELRRQGRLRPGVPLRQSGRGVVAGVGRRAARHRRQDAGPTGGEGLRGRRGCPDRGPVRGGQREHHQGHLVDRRRDCGDVADRLPLVRHHAPGVGHGARRDVRRPRHRLLPGELRADRAVDVLDQPPYLVGHRRRHGLHDLPARPLSRVARKRRRPQDRLLRHVPRHGTRRARVGADDRRRGGLPVLHPPAVLPEPRDPGRDRRARRTHRVAHAGSRRDRDRRPLRSARAKARDQEVRVATDRDGDRALARTDPHHHHRRSPSSGCWRCPATRRVTTSARTCPTTPRRTLATRRRSGTSRRRGSIPNC